MEDVILKMQGIVKVFAGVRALNHVDFELRKGEVHALIGENGAGKSTLMKILLGIYQADFGEVTLKGEQAGFRNPSEALRHGISMIHQEISLVPEMDVAENIWLGRERLFLKGGLIDKKRSRETEQLLSGLGLDIRPSDRVRDLSVAKMQLVELARAVSCDSDIIIMDEPTSALTNREVGILYETVRKLRQEGKSIIFISHKLEEIFDICQRVTVLRDGEYIATKESSQITMDQLISIIVGRKQNRGFEKQRHGLGEVALEVKGLNQAGVFRDVSFEVRKGEVLGFAGLMGAGRTEIMEAVFGLTRADSGQVLQEGKPLSIRHPGDAVRHRIGMVTEDRLRTGAVFTMSVMQNATLVILRAIANKITFFSGKKEMAAFDKAAADFKVKYSSADEPIGQLSGGNQQKVIFSRWLATEPEILILDEPTRGIDVGSKAEIYRLIDELAKKGMAILLISSELPELISLSDRIVVVRDGEIVYECAHEEADQETLITHAFGVQQET